MEPNRLIYFVIIFLSLYQGPDVAAQIEVIEVKVPQVVERGSKVVFFCNYDLKNESHYATRWFLREDLIFQVMTIGGEVKKEVKGPFQVETRDSNETHMLITDIPISAAGPWSCDIVGPPPRFERDVGSALLQIAVFPLDGPIISGLPLRATNQTNFSLNCTLQRAYPRGRISWKINGMQAVPSDVTVYPVIEHPDNTTTTIVGINLSLGLSLRGNSVHYIKCIGQIGDFYWKTKEISLKNSPASEELSQSPSSATGEKAVTITEIFIFLLLPHFWSSI